MRVIIMMFGLLSMTACVKKGSAHQSEIKMIDRDTDILSEEDIEDFPESK